MLKLWGYIPSAQCPLCSHKKCTLHHILVGFFLDQGHLESALQKLISQTQHKPAATAGVRRPFVSHLFVKDKKLFIRKVKHLAVKDSSLPRTTGNFLLTTSTKKSFSLQTFVQPVRDLTLSFGRVRAERWCSWNLHVAQKKGSKPLN